MSQFKTYDSVGIKEDVSDVVDTLDKQETPFSDTLGSRVVTQVLYKWQEDEQLAGGDNAKVEGFTSQSDDLDTTKMLMNTTQIMSREIETSGTLEATDHYGRKDERARQIVKKGKQLKQDYEYACIAVDRQMELGSKTVARRFASAFGLVDAGNRIANGGGALSEKTVRAAIRKSYDEGANATRLLVAPVVAEQTAEFDGNASRTRQVTDKGASEIVHVVDVYTTALGTLTIETARLMKPDYALLFRKGSYRRAVLKGRAWFTEKLAKTGDSTRTMMTGEYGLQIDNSKGAVVITGIDPDAVTP